MAEHLLQLAEALLAELAANGEPISAAKLCKRLGVRMSSLQRCASYLGDGVIGGQRGPGLVAMTQDGERQMLALTDKGRAECAADKQQASANDGRY